MDADLEARLRVIADQQEIHDLLVRYCRGVDRRDPRLILDAFHEDGTDGHGQGIVTRDLQPLPALSYSMELALVISRLRAAGVRITPGTYLGEIGEREATVYDVLTGEKQVREVDAV